MDVDRLLELDRAHVWHPYASATGGVPVYPVRRADGVRITLGDGRLVIDGMASWWAAIHGYNHPALNAAVTAQLERMAHVMFGGLTHEPGVALAALLAEITPAGLDRVFLCDSGSVSVEVALKLAIQYWQGRGRPAKQRLLTVRGGYHGDTFGAMAVCDPVNGMHHLFTGSLPAQLFAERPRCRYGDPVGDADLADLAGLLAAHRDELAAVVIEPVVQGAGGMYFYAPEYLTRLRALCTEHDVLLIFDEIATGFGRTGELFAAEHAAVAPDIMCLGKALTGGYLSMAATLCTDEVADGVCASEARVFMHGPTFMANPLAAAVARASVELLLAGPWRQRVAAIEAGLRAGLAPAAELTGVADVRVLGAIGVIETRAPIDVARVQAVALEHGVWLRPFGRLLYTMPPYIIGADELAEVTGAMVAGAAVAR
ncbi:MAG: adenosylmethionine--8-amino-7-oxononanoate transaminase [Sporichthyaceae bacterium]|nr:adenosylmethionine--8-amino-7-oxononanoate transaminase [Sporichthyaceae bacterium]